MPDLDADQRHRYRNFAVTMAAMAAGIALAACDRRDGDGARP